MKYSIVKCNYLIKFTIEKSNKKVYKKTVIAQLFFVLKKENCKVSM